MLGLKFHRDWRHAAEVHQPAPDQDTQQLFAEPHQEAPHRLDGGTSKCVYAPACGASQGRAPSNCAFLAVVGADHHQHHPPGTGLSLPGGLHHQHHQRLPRNRAHHQTLWPVHVQGKDAPRVLSWGFSVFIFIHGKKSFLDLWLQD